MSLQRVDNLVKYPLGIVEDIFIKVDQLVFPADFIVLDMDVDVEVPIILGRSFLVIRKAPIDVQIGGIVLRAMNEESLIMSMRL